MRRETPPRASPIPWSEPPHEPQRALIIRGCSRARHGSDVQRTRIGAQAEARPQLECRADARLIEESLVLHREAAEQRVAGAGGDMGHPFPNADGSQVPPYVAEE